MSGRGMTAFIGVITVAMGVVGLAYPLHVMDWVGFSPLMTNSSPSVFATVIIACRSERPRGSVSATVARSSQVAIRG